MRAFHWLGVALVWTWVRMAPAAEPLVVQRYGLDFADPVAAEESVRTLVGSQGKVVYDALRRQLTVTAPAAQQALVGQLLQALDVPPPNVQIRVSITEVGIEQTAGLGFGTQSATRVSGRTRHGSGQIDPYAVERSGTSGEQTEQILLVASGKEGLLRIGDDVPYLEWLTAFGQRTSDIGADVKWQKVGAGLLVEPTVLGDGPYIRVRLTPELRGLVDGSPYRIRMRSMSTEVTVKSGERLPIGSVGRDREFSSHFLVSREGSRTPRALTIALTPVIMNAAGRPR